MQSKECRENSVLKQTDHLLQSRLVNQSEQTGPTVTKKITGLNRVSKIVRIGMDQGFLVCEHFQFFEQLF